MTDLTPEERTPLTPEEQKMLFNITAASRMRQNQYLPEWTPNQTYGDLQPGHNLDMASIQHHLADLIVLTDWMPRVLAALVASEGEVSQLRTENTRLRRIERQVENERREDAEWEAFCRESDVRCLRCGLRYAERQDYGCQIEGVAHRYDEEELAEAREVRGESGEQSNLSS